MPMENEDAASISDESQEFDAAAVLRKAVADEGLTMGKRLEAMRLLRAIEGQAQEDPDLTLNRLSRMELEALASRIASERGLKPLTFKG